MSTPQEIREQARMRAQRHHTALSELIHDADIDTETKDAMRARLRGLWVNATIAMTLLNGTAATGERT